jgi:predicted TIM-barrel fold metal-dependent hydrolase
MHASAVAKVDRAIVFGLRAPLTGFFTVNDTVAEYIRTDPKKLIGFAAVCPTENNALAEVDRAVQELGLRGLKMSPIYGGWDPLDPRALKIFARAEELGLPIMLHQGTTYPRKAPLKYANPVLLEDIALRFPDLKMIIAHIGHPWEAEAIVLIRKQPNVFADISALFYRPWQYYNSLRLAVEYGVTDKLLFGTDYPITTFDESVKGLHDIVKLSQEMRLPPLPEDLPDQILHCDTLGLLGLDDPATL